MKRVYIFDVDNTLRSSKQQKVLPQTIKLIKELSKNPNNILGVATGRGPAKIHVVGELDEYFKFKVMVNGAVVLKDNQLMYEDPISNDDVKLVVNDAKSKGFSVGMVGYKNEALSFLDEHVSYALKGYTDEKPLVDPEYYLKDSVYQLWVFNKDQDKLMELAKDYPNFTPLLWHYGGVDLVYPRVSKENAVKKIMELYPEYELICVGDGHNDFGMIRLADVGIIMGNSRWIDEIRNDAKFIAPHVDDDKMYEFFKENNLI